MCIRDRLSRESPFELPGASAERCNAPYTIKRHEETQIDLVGFGWFLPSTNAHKKWTTVAVILLRRFLFESDS